MPFPRTSLAWGQKLTQAERIAVFDLADWLDVQPDNLMACMAWESGETLRLLDGEIAIDCPVRLLHGMADPDVPWTVSTRLADRLRSADVQTVLVKGGDHRLSRDQDLDLLIATLDDLMETL